MRLWRTPLSRAVLLGVALGAAGALLGPGVGASRDAELASDAAALIGIGALLEIYG